MTRARETSENARLAKAWVNFDGAFGTSPFTEANGGIRSSFNVSSITDHGASDYSINFTSALPHANYASAFSFNVGYTVNAGHVHSACLQSVSTTSVRFIMQIPPNSSPATTVECSIITAIFFG